MDYNNTAEMETKPGVSNKALTFAIVLLLLCAAAFAFFYYFYIVRTEPLAPAGQALTQEQIEAIISQEPRSPEEGALGQEELDAVIKAEGKNSSSGQGFSDEELLKIQKAN